MYEIGNECLLDLIIVAQSYVYFERLIIQVNELTFLTIDITECFYVFSISKGFN